MKRVASCVVILCAGALSGACDGPWNDPYVDEYRAKEPNTFYAAFLDRPKHLDPARSYTEDEAVFTGQIYEPPLQYHYLKRPYTLIPGSAAQMPTVNYFDAAGEPLPDDAPIEQIALSIYEIKIAEGVHYQPHPAFAVDEQGNPRYFDLTEEKLNGITGIPDFEYTGSRDVDAADYIYQIKRLAHPRVHSPIYGMMSKRIVGLESLSKELAAAENQNADSWIDLDQFTLSGVERIDEKTYRIKIIGKYPQFSYWLAMAFFAPVPREVDRFYSQPGMAKRNLSLDWWPVGSGPYMLVENNPNLRMVLEKNPNFHGETYPCEGEEQDRENGLLDDCGKKLPFVNRVVFTRERESIPYWNKFLQGYYDVSGISSESFDQAVHIAASGDIGLTETMSERGIRLLTSVRASIFYFGFNMLDPVLGRMDEKGKKLRQAISIAIPIEEFISIFMNGRGEAAMSPLPPGIFGYQEGQEGINPFVYGWDSKVPPHGGPHRKNIEEARRLLAEAGYPNGRDENDGTPLVLNIDTTDGGFGDKSQLDWIMRQFARLNIQLVVRSTDWNRLQEKMRKGSFQISFSGWNADYPDPENFFFLLYGPESRSQNNGENTVNYTSAEFDRLFEKMRSMDNTPERLDIINAMLKIVQEDAPWVFGFYPKSYILCHRWLYNRKPNNVANNLLKYQRVENADRLRSQQAWNQAVVWPLWLGVGLALVLLLPAILAYRRREQRRGK